VAIASDRFKAIITGEPLTGRDVYRPAIDFRPQAQHVFACNQLPTFHGGMDRGVIRRLMPIVFNRTIPEEERIPNIGQSIVAEELELVLAWAVWGLRGYWPADISRNSPAHARPSKSGRKAPIQCWGGSRTGHHRGA
jgi:phage/plasmid-associated DNA primase